MANLRYIATRTPVQSLLYRYTLATYELGQIETACDQSFWYLSPSSSRTGRVRIGIEASALASDPLQPLANLDRDLYSNSPLTRSLSRLVSVARQAVVLPKGSSALFADSLEYPVILVRPSCRGSRP